MDSNPNPRRLERVAMPSSRGSSPPRDPTSLLRLLALTGGFFTTSATWEVLFALICALKLDILVAYLFYEL